MIFFLNFWKNQSRKYSWTRRAGRSKWVFAWLLDWFECVLATRRLNPLNASADFPETTNTTNGTNWMNWTRRGDKQNKAHFCPGWSPLEHCLACKFSNVIFFPSELFLTMTLPPWQNEWFFYSLKRFSWHSSPSKFVVAIVSWPFP